MYYIKGGKQPKDFVIPEHHDRFLPFARNENIQQEAYERDDRDLLPDGKKERKKDQQPCPDPFHFHFPFHFDPVKMFYAGRRWIITFPVPKQSCSLHRPCRKNFH